jgi:hypothetical protein
MTRRPCSPLNAAAAEPRLFRSSDQFTTVQYFTAELTLEFTPESTLTVEEVLGQAYHLQLAAQS